MMFYSNHKLHSAKGKKEKAIRAYGGKCSVEGCETVPCIEKLSIVHDFVSINQFKKEYGISDIHAYLIAHDFPKGFSVVCVKHRKEHDKNR